MTNLKGETIMLKKVLMGMLAVIVIGAVVVGVADALTGKSVAAQTVAQTTAQTQAVAGNGQGNGAQTQGQGRGNGGQGQTTNTTPGTPQANITQTVTIAGVVQSFDGVGISVITDDGAPLWVQLGQSRYVSAQGAVYTAGDHVTATGFYENGQFQASSVVNDTTGQTLTLRDASGRPLWAGGGGNGGNGQGNH
jgi:hypothetical protein